MRTAFWALTLSAFLTMGLSAKAAEATKAASPSNAAPNTKAQPEPAPPAAERPPPYEPQLLRLAEMIGALAYLRNLCGDGDGDKFRGKMAALLEAEGVTEQRRDLLAGAYNRAFEDYQTSYRVCTPAAREVISRYLNETARLAADVVGRYGG
jgi:uncharacterized protein (TIGR02301 family)